MSEAAQNFEAFLIHPDFGGEAIAGKLFVDRRRLFFQSETIEWEMPLEQLHLRLGRGGDTRIYFGDPRHFRIRIFTEDDSIFEYAPLMQSERVRSQLAAALGRRELIRRLRITLSGFAACALIAWLGVLVTGLMVRSLAARVPPAGENRFGDAQIQELRHRLTFVDDLNEIARLTALAAPLIKVVPADGTKFKFHIVKSEYPNAFALPGGHIVITTALLQMADRPEELLGVIAHEMAHVTRRHFARKIISAAGPLVIFGIFLHSRDQTLEVLSGGSGLLVTRGFSQEYEFEADAYGWKYLVAANVDPRGMIDMFKKLRAFDAHARVASLLPQAFSSHPALDKRIARLERRWQELGKKSGFRQLPPLKWKQP